MLGWGEASAWHRRLAGLHCIPTATQMTGKPSKGGLLCNSDQKLLLSRSFSAETVWKEGKKKRKAQRQQKEGRGRKRLEWCSF